MTDWIEWNGGECPVGEGTKVQFKMREDSHAEGMSPCAAGFLDWSHSEKKPWEIVAYRVYSYGDCASALASQPAGTHYSDAAIQPVQFIEANKLGFLEGCIVKRATRHGHPTGKGAEDIRKITHEARLILELRYGEAA